jgi:hypothetical protein
MGGTHMMTSLNHLNQNHWTNPGQFKQTLTLRQLQESMLFHDGRVLANGCFWRIKYDKLCPGVYEVWLEKE